MSERWKSALLSQDSTIEDTVESSTRSSLRIVLTKDEKQRLHWASRFLVECAFQKEGCNVINRWKQ